MAGGEVRHVAAVPELNTRLGSLGMHGIRQFLESRQCFRADIQLAVEAHAAQVNGTISYSGHSYSAVRNANVVVV